MQRSLLVAYLTFLVPFATVRLPAQQVRVVTGAVVDSVNGEVVTSGWVSTKNGTITARIDDAGRVQEAV